MAAAIFGLIGVVVGGVLNGAVSAWLERKRQAADARSAARLVQTELGFFRAIANAVREHWPTELPQLRAASDPLWQGNRAVLSRALSDDSWNHVQRAYADVDAFLSLMVFEQDGNIIDWRVHEARRMIPAMITRLDHAIEALAPRDANVEDVHRPFDYEPAG